MDFHGVEIVCPACHAELERRGEQSDGALRCVHCWREYAIVVGIPDLRLFPDPYIDMEADRLKGARLERECEGLSFAESIRFYYSVTDAVPPFQARRFERGLLAASERSRASLQQWESLAPDDAGSLSLLDVGCGTAPLLAHAARRYQRTTGVDIAFRWLVLARKRLREEGMHVPLVCACAEALPFREAQFDRVVADSVIEHVREASRAMDEFHRVLRSDGWLFVTTPNRFSIGADPHVGLPAGGWLPDAVVAAYTRSKGGIPPKRTLFSRAGLRRLIERAGFTVRAIYPPPIPSVLRDALSPAARPLVALYNLMVRLPGSRQMLELLGPLLHGAAVKTDGRTAGDVGPAIHDVSQPRPLAEWQKGI